MTILMEECEERINDGTTVKHSPNGLLSRTFKENLLKLRWEIPVPEKCCCCLPLRHGFLVLAYIKLVLSMALSFAIFWFPLLKYLIFDREEIFLQVITWSAMGVDVLDIVIGILIIVSSYKKNLRIMEIYYRYSIYVFGLLSVLCSVIFHKMVGHLYALLILLLLFILIIVMQLYLILMVRGEVLKLRSNAQFQFLNNEPEPECTYTDNVDN